MALTRELLGMMKPHLRPGKMASLGYPDLIAPETDLESMVGSRIYSLKRRPDSEAICKRHLIQSRKIVDTRAFFDALGIELTVFDIVRERGEEVMLDLNYPLPEVHKQRFDFVIDIGTLEHCFNIGQALQNMAGLLKAGGMIFHENPFNWGNHGFYNINPTLYYDFYGINGFDVMESWLVGRDGHKERAEPTRRFVLTGGEAKIILCAGRKQIGEFVFPMQTKYRKTVSVN